MSTRLKIALVQMFVEASRDKNLIKASKLIRDAAQNGSRIVVLPEYFTCLMDPPEFTANKETTSGPSMKMLSEAARDNRIYLFGGTFPEAVPNSEMLYNTCKIYNPNGENIATFRKLHLYDVELGRKKIIESEVNLPGDKLTTVSIPLEQEECKVGFGVCLDLRFPEMARIYSRQGCRLLTYMGGFSTKTGPYHWEMLTRARAVDNQVFVANVGPAMNENSPYVCYGHSLLVDPWGDIVASTGAEEAIVYADIDLARIDEVRRQMPLNNHRRNDMYKLIDLSVTGTPV